jgi:DNA-binding HxlR family transcriptional regulator
MPEQLSAIEGTTRGLELVSGKWTMLVVFELNGGPKRPSELRRALPDISAKVLAQTLRRLQQHHLVRRTVHDTVPPQVEYTLTDLGRSLLEPLLGLCRWVDDHWTELQARPCS